MTLAMLVELLGMGNEPLTVYKTDTGRTILPFDTYDVLAAEWQHIAAQPERYVLNEMCEWGGMP